MDVAGRVVSVSCDRGHRFSKPPTAFIELVAGLGVSGDAHAGATVQHRSRVRVDPTQPNLRQVHLLPTELFAGLAAQCYRVAAGDLGENIATAGVDLLGLPRATRLHFPSGASIEVTGLRNPCTQLDRFASGLMNALLERTPTGELKRKAGIMAVVLTGGLIYAGDHIRVELPPTPHAALQPV